MTKNNKIVLKKNTETNVLQIKSQKSEFGYNLNLTRNQAGAYVLNGFQTDTENKLFVLTDSSVNKDPNNERVIFTSVNDVDGEITIECRTNGVLNDDIDYLAIYIDLEIE